MAENQTTAVAKPTKKSDIILAFNKVVEGNYVQNQLAKVLGGNAGSFTSSMIEIFSQDSTLHECDPKAVVREAMRAASLHLPLSKPLGRAYVVPFKIKGVPTPTFIIGWRGLVDLAVRTGQYETINAVVVHKGELRGVDKLSGFIDINGVPESTDIEGYIGYFRLTSGFTKMIYMTAEEMAHFAKTYPPTVKFSKSTEEDLVKLANEQSRNGVKSGSVGWFGDYNGMAKKTVIRRVLSWGPMSIELQQALANDPDYPSSEEIRDRENNQETVVVSAADMLKRGAEEAQATEVTNENPKEEKPNGPTF